MDDKHTRQADLDGLAPFFDAARTAPDSQPEPSGDLMARILADAAAAQPMPPVTEAARPQVVSAPLRPARRSWLDTLVGALDGWPAAAGLAAVACAGVLVGYSPPEAVATVLDGAGLTFADPEESPATMLAGFDAFLIDG